MRPGTRAFTNSLKKAENRKGKSTQKRDFFTKTRKSAPNRKSLLQNAFLLGADFKFFVKNQTL